MGGFENCDNGFKGGVGGLVEDCCWEGCWGGGGAIKYVRVRWEVLDLGGFLGGCLSSSPGCDFSGMIFLGKKRKGDVFSFLFSSGKTLLLYNLLPKTPKYSESLLSSRDMLDVLLLLFT